MALEEVVAAGVRNAFARQPCRRSGEHRAEPAQGEPVGGAAHRAGSNGSGRSRPTSGAAPSCWSTAGRSTTPIRSRRRSAVGGGGGGRDVRRLDRLLAVERELWRAERAAHNTSRLTPSRRLPVYLNAIEAPALASDAAGDALGTAALAATRAAAARARLRDGELLEVRRRALGADTGDRRAAVPRPGGGLLRRRPLRGGPLAARRRDADDPDRTAPPPPRQRPAASRERAGRRLARRQRPLVLARASPSPPSSRRAATT